MLFRFSSVLLIGTGLAMGSATGASAGSAQTTMAVTSLNLSSCAVVALPLAFGSINQIAGSVSDTQTTVTVTCTPGVTYNVGLDSGAHATSGIRHMQAATSSALIPYAIYSDVSYATAWGNTVGTDTVSRTATALPMSLTVYGRVPAGAALVAAGAYTDLVTVTVTF